MSLKTKLLGGFGVMILFAIIIAVVNTLNNFATRLQAELQAGAYVLEIQDAERLNTAVFDSGEQFATYQYTLNESAYTNGMNRVGVMENSSKGLHAVLSRYAAHLPVLANEVGPLDQHIAAYRKAAEDMHARASRLPALYQGMIASGEKVGALILDYFKQYRPLAKAETEKLDAGALDRRFTRYDSGLDILTAVGDARRKMFELQASRDPGQQTKLYNEARAMMGGIQKSIEDMRAGTKLEIWIARCNALLENIGQWNGYVDAIHEQTVGMNSFAAARQAAYQELMRIATALSSGGMANIGKSADSIAELIHRGFLVSLVLAVAALAVGLLIALGITASITRPVNRIIGELTRSSKSLEATGASFTHTASALAEETSSQAATLEETNANLQEIASATSQSAEDSQKTQDITMETIARIKSESESMHSMAAAMDDINGQADKISNIIKTIEGIAFQTNLLALNAAVEAARAGEAGKGFAVVADEVRNLAGRSASAAKDTGELIRATVESVHRGAEVTKQLEEGFGAIQSGSETIGGLVRQINESTQVQAQGVKQISDAMMRMDQVTQEISRSSMDSANEAKVLGDQTDGLREVVSHLIRVVNGGKMPLPATLPPSGTGKKSGKPAPRLAMKQPAGKALISSAASAPRKPESMTVSANEVIPLDGDDDF
ncbi:MAG: methyl-accepting chemotaxis protein [Planctomycetota bacterium]|jgi:archaellum component FlaC|nr:methyl-accepting chemotaxis protein [Planctomycetota bacterium]